MKKTIGSIGLGNIGEPMALNLLQSGYSVIGFDVVEKPAFVAAGGLLATFRSHLENRQSVFAAEPSKWWVGLPPRRWHLWSGRQ